MKNKYYLFIFLLFSGIILSSCQKMEQDVPGFPEESQFETDRKIIAAAGFDVSGMWSPMADMWWKEISGSAPRT